MEKPLRTPFRILGAVISLFAVVSGFMILRTVDWRVVSRVALGVFALIYGIDFGFIAWRGRGLLIWGRKHTLRNKDTDNTTEQGTEGDAVTRAP